MENNTWIVFKNDMKQMSFPTDASIRRYCRTKGAKSGWRFVEEEGHWAGGSYVCVYNNQEEVSDAKSDSISS